MEKNNCFSKATMILIKGIGVFPLVGIAILISILLHLHEIYSCLCYLVRNIVRIRVIVLKDTGKSIDTVDIDTEAALEPCSDTKNVKINLTRSEVEFVVERMSMFLDPKRDNIEERIGEDEIADIFNEAVRLEEVKEVFGVFDENGDGYIDAEELERVLNALGFGEATKGGCEQMIRAYDDNGDGRIDIGEFVKVLETSFP